MTMDEKKRTKELGDWGEQKAVELLTRRGSGFINVKDINTETANHPFGDVFAERVNSHPCVIGVKTRNKYQATGPLNATYNVRKKGFDIDAIGERYNAQLAWVAIQVIPELQTFNAYFGTIDQIQEAKERFSIPMKAHEDAALPAPGSKRRVRSNVVNPRLGNKRDVDSRADVEALDALTPAMSCAPHNKWRLRPSIFPIVKVKYSLYINDKIE